MISGVSCFISTNIPASPTPSLSTCLYTATSRSAELDGIGSETGTVAPGKCADPIVTAANPLEDLRALRHVGMLMARGQLTGHPRFKRRPEVEAQLDRFLTDESGAAAR